MNRRHFLSLTTVGTLAPALTQAAAPAPRIIDTHTHFYDPTRPEGVPWPDKGTPLYRKVMPADWQALARPHGVRETIVVEASPWLEDNQWVLDLAAQEKSILGFVGNLDPTDASFAQLLKRFAANPLFCGIRWRGEFIGLEKNQRGVLNAAKLLASQGLQLDLNGHVTTLPQAIKLAADVPDLRIVIDHLGNPGDPKAMNPSWKTEIQKLSRHPQVFMKVSALVEQIEYPVGQAPTDTAYYLPILDHLWETFGPDRLIYGSNWPVSDKGAPYATVFNIVDSYFTSKGAEAREKYFWKNSLAAYRWKERK